MGKGLPSRLGGLIRRGSGASETGGPRRAPGFAFLESLLQDVLFAVRLFRKTPLISATALLSLALGIGANTAIFSLIDAVLLRALPVERPEELVQVRLQSPGSTDTRMTFTNPLWEQLRDHQDVFFRTRSTSGCVGGSLLRGHIYKHG